MSRPIVLYNPRGEGHILPLGLVHVGSMATDQPVAIVDGRVELAPEARVVELSGQALCLGVSVLTGAPILDALRVSRAAKARNPGLPVIWGGWHPSLMPEQCLASGAVDACVVGQGERTFATLIDALREGRSFDGIPGVVWKREGEIVRNPPRPFEDVNGFPAADFGLLDMERYFRFRGARRLDYCSSQGCPFECAFCADPQVYKQRWSGLAAARVVAEIHEHVGRYRLHEVFFNDDNFFTDLRRTEAISRGLIEAGVRVRWFGTGRADLLRRLTDEQLRLLRQSGCYKVNVGAESGSPALLEAIKKGTLVEEVLETAEKLHRAGIGARFSFIAGFPREPKESLAETYRTAKAHPRDRRRVRDPHLLLRALSRDRAWPSACPRSASEPAHPRGLGEGRSRPLHRSLDHGAGAAGGAPLQLLPAARLSEARPGTREAPAPLRGPGPRQDQLLRLRRRTPRGLLFRRAFAPGATASSRPSRKTRPVSRARTAGANDEHRGPASPGVGEVHDRLLDLFDPKARGRAFPLVVGPGMDVMGDRVLGAALGPEGTGPSRAGAFGVEIGIKHDAAGARDPRQLAEKAREVGLVADHEPGHHEVEALLGKRKGSGATLDHGGERAAPSRQHPEREVEADQAPGAGGLKGAQVAAAATAEVEHRRSGQRRQETQHGSLLEDHQGRVGMGWVRIGPESVGRPHVELRGRLRGSEDPRPEARPQNPVVSGRW